jgi:hypothetical protein
MSSILRQLKKYQSPPKEIKEEPSTEIEKAPSTEISDEFLEDTGLSPALVDRVPMGVWVGVLYPHELEIIYHYVRKGRYIDKVEQKCDMLLQDFMGQQNPQQYIQTFKQAFDPRIKRLTMLRVLLASFRFGESRGDNVHLQHMKTAKEFLGIQGEISQEAAHRMLEADSATASTTEQILGRIGYILIWKELNGDEPPQIRQLLHGDSR